MVDGQEGQGSDFGERERQILEFERFWWKYAGAKERAIKESLDMSATRYYQLLNAANTLNRPACKVLVKIFQVFLQVLFGFSLRPVVGVILQIPEPSTIFFPCDNLDDGHDILRVWNKQGIPPCSLYIVGIPFAAFICQTFQFDRRRNA